MLPWLTLLEPLTWYCIFNSLAPGKFEWNIIYAIFKWILVIGGWVISCEIALIWMSLDFTDDQSTLVQVMAWCHQATSHYLSQCWPRSLSPYGITRPQSVKSSHCNSIQRSDTDLQMNHSDLTKLGHQFSSSTNGHHCNMPHLDAEMISFISVQLSCQCRCRWLS